MLSIIDHFSKYAYNYIIKKKDQKTVLEKIKDFIKKNGLPKKILTDNGKEFKNNSFKKYCKRNDITYNSFKKYCKRNDINSKSSTLVNEKFIFYEKNNTSRKSKKSKTKILNSNKIMNFSLKAEKSDEAKQKIKLIKNILGDFFDESDCNDVLNGEQSTYCQYFSEVFINNQIFINAFCIHEILRPR